MTPNSAKPLVKKPRGEHPSAPQAPAVAVAPVETQVAEATASTRAPSPLPDPDLAKHRRSFDMPDGLFYRARAAVVNTRNLPGKPLTLTEMVNVALEEYVVALERELNKGKPWPRMDGERSLPPGRPLR